MPATGETMGSVNASDNNNNRNVKNNDGNGSNGNGSNGNGSNGLSLHYRAVIQAALRIPNKSDGESFQIKCSLLSGAHATALMFGLIAVAFLVRLAEPEFGFWQFLSNALAIPVIILLATRLSLDHLGKRHKSKQSSAQRLPLRTSIKTMERPAQYPTKEAQIGESTDRPGSEKLRLTKPSPNAGFQQFFARGWNEQGFLFLDFKIRWNTAFPSPDLGQSPQGFIPVNISVGRPHVLESGCDCFAAKNSNRSAFHWTTPTPKMWKKVSVRHLRRPTMCRFWAGDDW